MEEAEQKKLIQQTFNTVAEGYGNPSMPFFQQAAAELPGFFELSGDEHLLDVATGSGIAMRALAPHVGQGRVTGIDFSAGMLEQARAWAEVGGHHNLTFEQMDMQAITFPDACFDAANCSFGVFFVDDMQGLLAHIAAKLKPGARLIATSFADDSFGPNVDLFLQRIESYGVESPPFSWQRISTEDKLATLFRAAGLTDVRVHRRDMSYHLDEVSQWWDIIWYAGFRGLVDQLDEPQLARFKQEHLADIGQLRTGQGIPVKIEVLYGVGHVA